MERSRVTEFGPLSAQQRFHAYRADRLPTDRWVSEIERFDAVLHQSPRLTRAGVRTTTFPKLHVVAASFPAVRHESGQPAYWTGRGETQNGAEGSCLSGDRFAILGIRFETLSIGWPFVFPLKLKLS